MSSHSNRDADTSCTFDYLAEMFAEKRGTKNPADVPKVRPCVRCGHLTIERTGTAKGSRAVFSDDGKYRYRLTRLLNEYGKAGWICWILLNPSTADENVLDPTLRRCRDFSLAWGHEGMIIVNLFGLRATNPKELAAVVDPVGEDNDEHIAWAVGEADRIMVAWGTHPMTLRFNRRDEVRRILDRASRVVFALKLTRSGAPGHPLYLPKDLLPFEYRT